MNREGHTIRGILQVRNTHRTYHMVEVAIDSHLVVAIQTSLDDISLNAHCSEEKITHAKIVQVVY